MSTKNKLVDFRAVREAVSMERLLEHYGLLEPMKRSGDSLSGFCPLHQGSNPTQFRVSISKNLWNCFGQCHHGGNVIDFIARKEGVSAYAAAQKAIEWFQLPPEQVYTAKADDGPPAARKAPEPAARPKLAAPPATQPPVRPTEKPVATLTAKPAARPTVTAQPPPESTATAVSNPPLKFRLEKLQPDHPYLVERGLTPETLAEFGVGFCSKGMMADRIAIPIHTLDGQVVAYAGRWPGEAPEGTPKYKLPPGFRKSLELFNLDRARKEPAAVPLIVVEGFFDAMKLFELGHLKVVALMGSSLSSAQEDLIRRHTRPDSRILVMLDEDEAGRAARDEIASRLARFAFVRIHAFEEEGRQPEHLTADEVSALFA